MANKMLGFLLLGLLVSIIQPFIAGWIPPIYTITGAVTVGGAIAAGLSVWLGIFVVNKIKKGWI